MNILNKYRNKWWVIPTIILLIILFSMKYMPGVLLGFIGSYTIISIKELLKDIGLRNNFIINFVVFLIVSLLLILFLLLFPLIFYEIQFIFYKVPLSILKIISESFHIPIPNSSAGYKDLYNTIFSSIMPNNNVSSIFSYKSIIFTIISKFFSMLFQMTGLFYNITTFFVSIILFYSNWNECCSFILSCLPVRNRVFLTEKQSEFNKLFRLFLLNQAKTSFMNAIFFAASMKLIGIPYILSTFALVFFASFLPYFGCIIGYTIVSSIILLNGYSSYIFISISIMSLICYGLENYLLVPVLLGSGIGIPPIIIMVIIPFLLQVLGPMATLFAIPIILGMKISTHYLFETYAIYSLEKKKKKETIFQEI